MATDPIALEESARAAYEAVRADAAARGAEVYPPWDDASAFQKLKMRARVRAILDGGEKLGDLHEAWRAKQSAEGWKHGQVSDSEKREHTHLVPFRALPPAERRREEIIFDAVLARGKAP